jgi:TnpA family transposase
MYMKKENSTKAALLSAFDKSENKQVREVCRIVGVTPSCFYFHYYKDADFRRRVLESKRNHLSERAASV